MRNYTQLHLWQGVFPVPLQAQALPVGQKHNSNINSNRFITYCTISTILITYSKNPFLIPESWNRNKRSRQVISQIYLHIFNDCWVSSHSWTNNKAVKSWKPIFHLFYRCFSISEIDPFKANEAIKSISCTNVLPKAYKFFFFESFFVL